MATDTGKITINVAVFHGINDRYDPAKLCELDTSAPIVITDDAGGRLYQLSGDPTIRVKGKKAINLVFAIEPKANYTVAGAAFNSDGLNGFGAKKNNFDIGDANGNELTIVNRHARGYSYWDVLIAVQDKATGLVGIIDPGVENEE